MYSEYIILETLEDHKTALHCLAKRNAKSTMKKNGFFLQYTEKFNQNNIKIYYLKPKKLNLTLKFWLKISLWIIPTKNNDSNDLVHIRFSLNIFRLFYSPVYKSFNFLKASHSVFSK